MTDLLRRDERPELGFFELSFPSGPPPLDPLSEDADGNARTLHAWARAHYFLERLKAQFPALPAQISWGYEAIERERFVGDWPDGDYESYAYIGVGLLFDPGDAEARAFAERVRAEKPAQW